ncbi:MAG: hypothetical protein GXY27_04510 [Erysipelotrichaceae bacterium]|nr:hypothetical protein [Erysipelotrichaceae bacterium]
MGTIRTEVTANYLNTNPGDRELLLPFLDGFHVTWANIIRGYNTALKVFFLSPEEHYKESYGFENEILLVYAPYERMEPRTLQAIEQIFTTSPAKGRVETLNYFLISDSESVNEWLDAYISSRQETRIIVPFTKTEIINAKADNWFVRNKLNSHFFGRDLFNYSLPLVEDAYFFGRQNIIMEYYDAIRRNENKAIFGLRKTGKTSLLFKLKRRCESEKLACVLYFDCKLPHIRKVRWYQLLNDIANNISEHYNITNNSIEYTEVNASKLFMNLIRDIYQKGEKICLMFDEIEYISFITNKDKHWKDDYIEFWQTFWSCQSQFKCLSYIIAGVNPSTLEIDLINGVQNPLFGIVPHRFLTGLDLEETKTMLKKLGKRMGLVFSQDVITAIHNWYGGHPLLTRQACSTLNTFLSDKLKKPIEISSVMFNDIKSNIDQELTFYSNHAISEIKEFYPDEYYMLELLATGQELDFRELSMDSSNIKHLCSYELLKILNNKLVINIPVIAQRVAMESKRSEGRELVYPIVKLERRLPWLKRRIQEIVADINVLEKLINKVGKKKLFGINSFPEGASFASLPVVTDLNSFLVFINIMNRCFVESIESYGLSISIKDYFWKDIKADYGCIWPILNRIKVYRNERDHLHLNNSTTDYLVNYLEVDFEGRKFSQIEEPYFVLQQRILDGFLLQIQNEIDAIS